MPRLPTFFLIVSLLFLPKASALAVSAFLEQSARQTPSLADLPRGQPRRKLEKKVYTNDDLVSARSARAAEQPPSEPSPAAVPPSQAETASPTEEAASESLPKERDPSYWRERVAPLQQELARLEEEIRRLSGLTGTMSHTQTGAGMNLAGGGGSFNPQQTLENLERRKQELESRLTVIAEEARRARVPRGWVR